MELFDAAKLDDASGARLAKRQSFFHEHSTPVDEKFVKMYTDSVLAQIYGFGREEECPHTRADLRNKGGWRSLFRRAAFCLAVYLVPGVKGEASSVGIV